MPQRDAKLYDLIILLCDAAFACGNCPDDKKDNVIYKPLFDAEQEAIVNLQNHVADMRAELEKTTAISMRSACVEKVKRVLVDHDRGSTGEPCSDFMGCDCGAAFDKAEFITALESLSIEKPKE